MSLDPRERERERASPSSGKIYICADGTLDREDVEDFRELWVHNEGPIRWRERWTVESVPAEKTEVFSVTRAAARRRASRG